MDKVPFNPFVDVPLSLATVSLFIWHFHRWAVSNDLDASVDLTFIRTMLNTSISGINTAHFAGRFHIRHTFLNAGEITVFNSRSKTRSNGIQIYISHARSHGFISFPNRGLGNLKGIGKMDLKVRSTAFRRNSSRFRLKPVLRTWLSKRGLFISFSHKAKKIITDEYVTQAASFLIPHKPIVIPPRSGGGNWPWDSTHGNRLSLAESPGATTGMSAQSIPVAPFRL